MVGIETPSDQGNLPIELLCVPQFQTKTNSFNFIRFRIHLHKVAKSSIRNS